MDVGCWMFSSFGSGIQSANTGIQRILAPSEGERVPASAREGKSACFHCGEPCSDPSLTKDNKAFCCQGCLFVHDLLAESGLG